MIYDVIIVGAGASGLFFGSAFGKSGYVFEAFPAEAQPTSRQFHGLILEKGKRAGTKLLMSGAGQCNITHTGSIKEFIGCYGGAGRLIRNCLYKYNNLSLIAFLEKNGVKTVTREDGKVFPASLDARDVLKLLLRKTEENGFEIRYECPVAGIEKLNENHMLADHPADQTGETHTGRVDAARRMTPTARWRVFTVGEAFFTNTLVIASGGCSYPSTGSDGSMFQILTRDLGVEITPLKPALSPIRVEDYPYGGLSGISFDTAQVSIWRGGEKRAENGEQAGPCEGRRLVGGDGRRQESRRLAENAGPLLFTHHDLSGPAVLNISKFAEPGDTIKINYIAPLGYEQALARLKEAAHSARGSLAGTIATEFHLPLRFCKTLTGRYGNSLKTLAKQLTGEEFQVSSVTGFSKAMATSGGVALSEMDMRSMEFKNHSGLYAIGEALDVDGITGGYNLQFAYSSARTAADSVLDEMAERRC